MAAAEQDLDTSDQPYTWKDFAAETWEIQRRIRAKLATILDNQKCGYRISDNDQEYFEEWNDACEEFDRKVKEGEIQEPSAADGTASTSQTGATATAAAASAAGGSRWKWRWRTTTSSKSATASRKHA